MKIKIILQVEHPAYGKTEFHSSKEFNDTTPPINLQGLVTQHFVHVVMKMCHILTNCYRNNLKFSESVYDITPGGDARVGGLTAEESARRRDAVKAVQA